VTQGGRMFGWGAAEFEHLREQGRIAKIVMENRRDFGIFFGALGIYLDERIAKANTQRGDGASELIRRGRLKEPTAARAWTGKTTIEMTMGTLRTCTLSLSGALDKTLKPCAPMIDAELESDAVDGGNRRRERISFVLEDRLSGTKGYRMGPDGRALAQKEFGAAEIAEVVVAGIVHGRFE